MRIESIAIGDELLLGFTIDTNHAHLARELAATGISVVRRTTVGDNAEDIADAVRGALERTGGVITTGGLGPTSDDRTKESIAAVFGRDMHLDADILASLENRWRDRGWPGPLPAANRQQAMIPEGARILVNRHGSAPGIWLEDDRGRWVAMLPGVPREMRGMLADELGPLLAPRASGAGVVRSRTLRTTGIAESALADLLGESARGFPGVSLAYLPGHAGTDLRLTTLGAAAEVDARLEECSRVLMSAAARWIYGEGEADVAEVVLERARSQGRRIAVAESCTGGLLGGRLTAVAGSSDVFVGGVIAYDNSVKREQLGVPESDLREHGAVSEAVVKRMASGARERFQTDIGIAITGVAGPGGGTPEKPVGTVWIAADVEGDVAARRLSLIGDREEIRQRAAQAALDLTRRVMNGDA